jgi:hypothetical protein
MPKSENRILNNEKWQMKNIKWKINKWKMVIGKRKNEKQIMKRKKIKKLRKR